MKCEFESVFLRLRKILCRHAAEFTVESDTESRYCLVGPPGPAAIKSWGGKVRATSIPVAWVNVGKAYVSFHLMGLDGNPQLLSSLPHELTARMQGKSCFNFSMCEEALFQELEEVTSRAIARFKWAGYVCGIRVGAVSRRFRECLLT